MVRFIQVSCASNTTEKHDVTQVKEAGGSRTPRVVKTCTTATSPTEWEGGGRWRTRPGKALATGGGEMTPGELKGKWEDRERVTNTVPLPEHLGERGVAVIRPGGRRGAGEGRVGWEEERVSHAKERQKGYWQRVTGKSD